MEHDLTSDTYPSCNSPFTIAAKLMSREKNYISTLQVNIRSLGRVSELRACYPVRCCEMLYVRNVFEFCLIDKFKWWLHNSHYLMIVNYRLEYTIIYLIAAPLPILGLPCPPSLPFLPALPPSLPSYSAHRARPLALVYPTGCSSPYANLFSYFFFHFFF